MYKIAVVGPESTGKSVLASELAAHYGSPWVPEYARTYVEQLSEPYNFDDICHIAHKQIEQEIAFEGNNPAPFVFFDTDLIITKVWFSYCYQQVPAFVEDRLQTGFFDLYLLCEPDLPWEPDPVREHGHDRGFFFDWYKTEIEKLGKPYLRISGTGKDRIRQAIKKIDYFISNTQTGR
ncbi:MAG: ATP-binding protein [Paludibacter sp.]|jgi:NadR type nicotinamide-nucleotide adenylyltransferase|nr:ATP-binding protein [Paludibacter sp.]